MRVEARIRIAVPREKVWEYVSDPARYPEFWQGARFWPVDGEPTVGLRARFNVWMQVRSAEVGGLIEVIEWDPPKELAWTSITGVDQRGRWRLRESNSDTMVWLRLSYQAPGGLLALIADRVS